MTVRIQCAENSSLRADISLDKAQLSVTTFNVWGLPSWINGASSTRYAKIANELDRLGSDVVLLQEVWTYESYRVLSEMDRPGHAWWSATARRKGLFLGQSGLLTLSRLPIERAEFRLFSTASMPDQLMHKGALKVTLVCRSGDRINIWNVHLQDGHPRTRTRQTAELVKWINETEDGEIADIVGGDFNFTPDSKEYIEFSSAIGPSVHQVARMTELPTWDGLKTPAGGGESLDHIFVRIKIPVGRVAARPRRVFTADRPRDRLSDHMGVEVSLVFQGDREASATTIAWGNPAGLFREVSAALSP